MNRIFFYLILTSSILFAQSNSAPTIYFLPDQTIHLGETLSVQLNVFDPENDNLSFEVVAIPYSPNSPYSINLQIINSVLIIHSTIDSLSVYAISSYWGITVSVTDGDFIDSTSFQLISYPSIPSEYDILIYEITIPTNSDSIYYSPILTEDKLYYLKASGSFSLNDSTECDAAYCSTFVSSMSQWVLNPSYHRMNDGINNGLDFGELGSPTFSEELLVDLINMNNGEIPYNRIDDNGNGFIDENTSWIGKRYADGIDNWYLQPNLFIDGEDNSPLIDSIMITEAANDPFHRYFLPSGCNTLWGVTNEWIGMKYADCIDNDGDGYIDESIDFGIDGYADIWMDGIDNDGDGYIDETDEMHFSFPSNQLWVYPSLVINNHEYYEYFMVFEPFMDSILVFSIIDSTLDDNSGEITIQIYEMSSLNIDNGTNPKIPNEFSLFPAYPNPFNPVTTIDYTLPMSGFVTLSVYDIMGREIETLVNENVDSGVHSVLWNGSDSPSGIYFIKMMSNRVAQTQKVLLLK